MEATTAQPAYSVRIPDNAILMPLLSAAAITTESQGPGEISGLLDPYGRSTVSLLTSRANCAISRESTIAGSRYYCSKLSEVIA